MKKKPEQVGFFIDPFPQKIGTTFVNERCRIQECDGCRVVSVSGIAIGTGSDLEC